eukprot:8106428-Pyramimonas_sp.AAC.1
MTRSNLNLYAGSRYKRPTRTGPSKSRARSSNNVGTPEFRLTRVLLFTDLPAWNIPDPYAGHRLVAKPIIGIPL